MARLPRLSLAGHAHVVEQRCVHGQVLTVDDTDRQNLLVALRDAARAQGVAVWGYAVLPHALHLVLCPATADSLGRAMQTLGRRYVAAFNARHARSGALWAGRFRAAVVQPGEWTLQALARVDRLGQDAGAASSADHHLGRTRDPLLTDPPELWSLGNTPFERESAWKRRLEQPVDPVQEQALARAVLGAWVAGDAAFVASIADRVGRPAAPRRPGRPRKMASA